LSTKGVSSLISLELYRIFTFPVAYLLLFVLLGTAVLQVKYLNKALARFSSTVPTPSSLIPVFNVFPPILIPSSFAVASSLLGAFERY
jgi:Magnesium transporter NIPA